MPYQNVYPLSKSLTIRTKIHTKVANNDNE